MQDCYNGCFADSGTCFPHLCASGVAGTGAAPDVVLMLVQRRRRWANNKTTLVNISCLLGGDTAGAQVKELCDSRRDMHVI